MIFPLNLKVSKNIFLQSSVFTFTSTVHVKTCKYDKCIYFVCSKPYITFLDNTQKQLQKQDKMDENVFLR